MTRRGKQRGFTLIETLVSLAIATLAITGFYQALSTGLFMERRSGVQAEQMLVATQIMDRVGVDFVVRPGVEESGIIRDLGWSLVISESGTSDMRVGRIQPNELLFVYVTIAAQTPDGTSLVLRGIRYRETPL
jgi:prepilin-type N-terminal cleavage/methylation domain-containing protein